MVDGNFYYYKLPSNYKTTASEEIWKKIENRSLNKIEIDEHFPTTLKTLGS